MEEILEKTQQEIEKFLTELAANNTPQLAPFSFFVKEMGWIHVKFFVPVLSTDGTSYIDAISTDGAHHQIKEDFIIDKRTNSIQPAMLKNFVRMLGESLEEIPTEHPESEMFG